MSRRKVTVRVIGRPAPWQNKTGRGFDGVIRGKPGSKYAKPWRQAVSLAFLEEFRGEPMAGPVLLTIDFHFERPKSHFRSGKYADQLKESAPKLYHAIRPDRTNLIKGTEDGITDAMVWTDDELVCDGPSRKLWCAPGEPPGATITVEELE